MVRYISVVPGVLGLQGTCPHVYTDYVVGFSVKCFYGHRREVYGGVLRRVTKSWFTELESLSSDRLPSLSFPTLLSYHKILYLVFWGL